MITSIAENKGIPGFTAYSATKAAARSFVRTWTAELKDRRIRVNTISPGPIDTSTAEDFSRLAGFDSLLPRKIDKARQSRTALLAPTLASMIR